MTASKMSFLIPHCSMKPLQLKTLPMDIIIISFIHLFNQYTLHWAPFYTMTGSRDRGWQDGSLALKLKVCTGEVGRTDVLVNNDSIIPGTSPYGIHGGGSSKGRCGQYFLCRLRNWPHQPSSHFDSHLPETLLTPPCMERQDGKW